MKKIQIKLLRFCQEISKSYITNDSFLSLLNMLKKYCYEAENIQDLQKEIINDLYDYNIGFNNNGDCFKFLQKYDCKLEITNKIYKHLDKNIDLDIFQLCFLMKKELLVAMLNKIIELYQAQNNK